MKKLTATSNAVLTKIRNALAAKNPANVLHPGDTNVFYFGDTLKAEIHVAVTEIRAQGYKPIYVVRQKDDGDCILVENFPDEDAELFPAIPLWSGSSINSQIYYPIPVDVFDRINGQAIRLVEEAMA